MDTEIVKMSPKGQLVVPQEIRDEEGFEPGDRFIPFPMKNGVLFKRIKIPDVKVEFQKLSKEIEQQFKKLSISEKDVDDAVKWAKQN
jgi:bifunctional DNA-binding transcriptional regulator/antitoxin component of YhaV-PrlF toxin-antitoxin module